MRRFLGDLNPTVRGFLVIALIAGIIVVLQLEQTLTALFLIAQIAFFLAIAFFVYLVWRERRDQISQWSRRARAVFYGAGLLIVVNMGSRFFAPARSGWDLLAFIAVFVIAGFAMWRIWRDEHTYVY